MRASRISDSATRERRLRDDAAGEAADLFASHGSGAIDVVSARLLDQSRSPEQRRGDRLTLLEVERLDRVRRQRGVGGGSSGGALVAWKPPLFSRAWLAALFRRKPRHRRR